MADDQVNGSGNCHTGSTGPQAIVLGWIKGKACVFVVCIQAKTRDNLWEWVLDFTTYVGAKDRHLSVICLSDSHIPIFIINTKYSVKIDNIIGNDSICEQPLQLLLSPPTPALHPCWDIQPSGEEAGRGGAGVPASSSNWGHRSSLWESTGISRPSVIKLWTRFFFPGN